LLVVGAGPGSLAAPALPAGAAAPAALGLLELGAGLVAGVALGLAFVVGLAVAAELPALVADGGIATAPAAPVAGEGALPESSPPQLTAAKTLVQAIEITLVRHNGLAMPTS
jgi:hypothetical protein